MKNLPEEFKEVSPVSSVEECMSIVASIIPSSTTPHIDRYRLKLAKTYFMKNLRQFSTQQVDSILQHSYFKKFDGDFFNKAIEFSIKNQWVFPITFSAWFEKETKNYDRSRYLELINKNNHQEQLKLFCSHKSTDLDSFFRNHEPSYYLSLFAQEQDPKYILYNKTWNKQELKIWFEKHPDQMGYISKNSFAARNVISKNVQEVYYQFLSDFVISDEKQTTNKTWERPFIQSLCVMPTEFWKLIEEKSPGLIRDKISLPMQVKEKKSYTSNYAQGLMGNVLHNGGIHRVLETFEPYWDLGLSPMKETISTSNYEIMSDAFEVALRNNILYLLVPYAYNFDLLNENQKEIMVAACFSWLMKDKKFDTSNDEIYTLWADQTLSVADTSIVEKYLKINKNNFNDNDNLERVEVIIRSKKLEDQLPEKGTFKRMKI
jgi:hypothetical protein